MNSKVFKSPNFQGLRILSGPNSSSSSSYCFVNGESKSDITTTFSYYLSASKEGSCVINPASVYAYKKTISSKPITITVVKGRKQNNNSITKNLFNRFVLIGYQQVNKSCSTISETNTYKNKSNTL